MKVCIIGAGISGLSSIRRCREHDLECVCYELASDIGGQWLYSENTGINEYGLPVLSSIYPSLRTNLPTIAMEFGEYPFKVSGDTCYPGREEVIKYIREFTDHFNLRLNIKFCHRVELVKRAEHHWEVTVKDFESNETFVNTFDAIIVATGHYSVPFIPDILGIDSFYGTTLHSHYYRRPDMFRNKTVVIVGGGTSALDICYAIGGITNKTYFSQHHADLKELTYPENVLHKPDIKYISNDQVHFVDGSVEWADVILLCTGYKFYYPFLDESCEIKVTDHKFVYPLYKMMINISHPTMAFLGIPMRTVFFAMSDLQARVFTNVLLSIAELPSREQMMKEWEAEIDDKKKKNMPINKYHTIGEAFTHTVKSYMRDLEAFAKLPVTVPDVLIKIFTNNAKLRRKEYSNFKDQKYTIVDERTYRLEYKGQVIYG